MNADIKKWFVKVLRNSEYDTIRVLVDDTPAGLVDDTPAGLVDDADINEWFVKDHINTEDARVVPRHDITTSIADESNQ